MFFPRHSASIMSSLSPREEVERIVKSSKKVASLNLSKRFPPVKTN